MFSIKQNNESFIEINKSKFHTYCFKVEDLDDVELALMQIKQQHPKANHHCYGYVLGYNQETRKYSDDGEPSMTAGYPILETILNYDLTYVLIIVVRYFGGIKLGKGGLIRAYKEASTSSLIEEQFTSLNTYYEISVTIDFDQIGICEKYIRDNFNLLDTIYTDKVTYKIKIVYTLFSNLEQTLIDKTSSNVTITVDKTYKQFN